MSDPPLRQSFKLCPVKWGYCREAIAMHKCMFMLSHIEHICSCGERKVTEDAKRNT